jgi:hypothetical protein
VTLKLLFAAWSTSLVPDLPIALQPDVRLIIVGPAPRGEDAWPDSLIIPGAAPVLPVQTQAVPATGPGYTNLR